MKKKPTPLDRAIQELEYQEYEHERSVKSWVHVALEALADTDIDQSR